MKAPPADLMPRNIALKKLLKYHERYAVKVNLRWKEINCLIFMMYYRPQNIKELNLSGNKLSNIDILIEF